MIRKMAGLRKARVISAARAYAATLVPPSSSPPAPATYHWARAHARTVSFAARSCAQKAREGCTPKVCWAAALAAPALSLTCASTVMVPPYLAVPPVFCSASSSDGMLTMIVPLGISARSTSRICCSSGVAYSTFLRTWLPALARRMARRLCGLSLYSVSWCSGM
ncbi:hypothetical protein DFH08DRAFT_865924 [Mycena albidolilacea]|uniref:Uncharacterized protein n=1 Tax=Mycena albidolilacea TaxID=1033008 RepID=A0AAD7A2S7_9AGAR|nr:hypothetical protein DFH08DRAFT_865924 [Mycena albidolilacea]